MPEKDMKDGFGVGALVITALVAIAIGVGGTMLVQVMLDDTPPNNNVAP